MRKIHPGDPTARRTFDREPSETVKTDCRDYGEVTLRGEAVGKSPEDLLTHAISLLQDHEERVQVLLRHVPRKYEEKINALEAPRRQAFQAIGAVGILMANARSQFEATK